MKTFLKIVGVIVILFIAALFILPVVFKDDIVKLVKTEANDAVNAKIDFGDFDLSLIRSFPNFYFGIEDVSVTGIDEFEGVKLAEIKELSFVVDVMSVIRGESIQVKRISINLPQINVQVLADGKANYDIAKESETDEVEEEPTDTTASSFQLKLQKVEIVDGEIVYNDATMPMNMVLQKLNVDLSGDMTADITNLDINATIASFDLTYDGMKMMDHAKVALDALIEMNLDKMKFTFKDNELKINELPLTFDGWVEMPNDPIDMDLTFAAKKTDFKTILSMVPAEFTKDLEGVKTTGTLALQGYAKGTYLDSIYPAFGIDLQVKNGKFQYPDLPKSVDNIQIIAKVDNKTGDLNATIVDVPKFHLEMANNPFDLNFYLATPMTDPFIRAGMKGKIMLDNIKDVIPLEKGDQLSGILTADISLEGHLSSIEKEAYEDFKANGNLMAEGIHYASDSLDYPVDVKKASLTFSPQYLSLDQLQMQLGKSDLDLNGKVENYLGYALKDKETLKGVLNIQSQLLDVNELAGLSDENSEETKTAEDTTSDAPMETLLLPKYIDFKLNANVAKILFDNIVMQEVKAEVGLKEEKLSMKDAGLKMLGGAMTANGFYETTNPIKPTYDFALNVNGFDVQNTIETFNSVETLVPIARSTKGSYSTQLQIKGALTKNMDPVYESMYGKGELQTQNIAIVDYKPFKKIADAIKYDKLNPLELNDIDLSFKISEGKVFVEPFTVDIGKTELTIAGSNSFDQTIDYTFSFAIPREEFGKAANQAVDGLLAEAAKKGVDLKLSDVINIDVQLVGPASDPKIKTNFKETKSKVIDDIKNRAKEELEKKKKELEDKAKAEIDKAKAEVEKKKEEAKQKVQEEIDKQKKKAQEEIDKQKQKIQDEIDKRKKEAKKDAKKKLDGLFD